MIKQKVKRIMIAFAAVVALWVAVFLGVRYGVGEWRAFPHAGLLPCVLAWALVTVVR